VCGGCDGERDKAVANLAHSNVARRTARRCTTELVIANGALEMARLTLDKNEACQCKIAPRHGVIHGND